MDISLPYDILFSIASFSDDKTVINISLSCKKFYYKYFKKLFDKRYSDLHKIKRSNETLEALYLRKLYYIHLLRKEFQIVYKEGNPILLYGFKKYGTNDIYVLFRDAIKNENLEMVQTILEDGMDINCALIAASKYPYLSIVKYLVESGANIHAQKGLPLEYASENGHLDVVKYLIEGGADIGARNNEALIKASQNGHLPVVKYLVEAGANIRANDFAAAKQAIWKGHLEILVYLVEAQKAIDKRDKNNFCY